MFDGAYDFASRPQDKAIIPGYRLDVAQRAWEISQLLRWYFVKKPMRVLEIGVYEGGTLYGWLQYAQPGATIITIDLEEPRPFWQEWVRDDVELIHFIGDSHCEKVIQAVQAKMPQIDFLFIDADHTYDGVKADFENYGKLVVSGGIIALHDIIDPHPNRHQDHIQVSRLWRKIRQAGYVTQELVCHPGQDWGGIGVIYP